MLTMSGWSGSVKHSGLMAKLGACLVTSRTRRQELGLFLQPTVGSANITMGNGT